MAGKTSISLVESALPKSGSGRRAAELSEDLITALVTELEKTPIVKDEVSGEDRPRALGPADNFDTEGKAGSMGRRYALAVANRLEKKVRVNIYGDSKGENGKWMKPFHWRIYVPLSEGEETAS